MKEKKAKRNKKKSKWYGKPMRGLMHASSEDYWIRILHTTILAGNGASLIFLANFLKGENLEKTFTNLNSEIWAISCFFLGVVACGLATLLGAWEKAAKRFKQQEFSVWKEHDYLYAENDDAEAEFNIEFPIYQKKVRRFWEYFIFAITLSLTFFIFGTIEFAKDIVMASEKLS